jgi:hypothetical protein
MWSFGQPRNGTIYCGQHITYPDYFHTKGTLVLKNYTTVLDDF